MTAILYRCGHCHALKPVQAFYRNNSKPGRRSSWCAACYRTYQRERAQQNAVRKQAIGRADMGCLPKCRHWDSCKALTPYAVPVLCELDDEAAGVAVVRPPITDSWLARTHADLRPLSDPLSDMWGEAADAA